MDQLIRGLPLLLCSHTGGTPPHYDAIKMKHVVQQKHDAFWALRRTSISVTPCCIRDFSVHAPMLKPTLLLDVMSVFFSGHTCGTSTLALFTFTICLLAGGMLRFGSRCVLYVVSCVESFSH